MKYYKILFFLVAVAFTACESLEDTYSEWTKDGITRYVGRVNDLQVESGWKRLKISWVNSSDATVKQNKIVWYSELDKDSATVDGSEVMFETEQVLNSKIYTVDVYAIDGDGNQSLSTTQYGQPFDENHEAVNSFGKIEKKFFYLKDNLIIYWGSWVDNGMLAALDYFNQEGQQTLDLTAEVVTSEYTLIENIDINQKVFVNREAFIEGCYDRVVFEPYELDPSNISMYTDFLKQVKERYNIDGDLTPEFMNNVEELELDFSLYSMEDILYFPNLKKLVLGKGRYFDPSDFLDRSKLTDRTATNFAIQNARNILGVELEVYNNHYGVLPFFDFAVDMGNPLLPDFNYLDYSNWTVTVDTEEEGHDSGASNILDNNPSTIWEPLSIQNDSRIHKLDIDMQTVKPIKGFVIKQPLDRYYSRNQFAESVHVMYSQDGKRWEQAFYYNDVQLGKGRGEARVLNFPQELSARFVRVSVKDVYGSRSYTYLADFVLF